MGKLKNKLRTVENGDISTATSIKYLCVKYAAVFDGSDLSRHPFPQFALWATNISPSSTVPPKTRSKPSSAQAQTNSKASESRKKSEYDKTTKKKPTP